uniref:glycosyltransferase family 2 protein n=1 Tax=Castellaniella defragrans TaxID=75697 RepID=UPI003340AB2C
MAEGISLQVIVPTYNGGALWRESARSLRQAADECRHCVEVLVVDSSSRDDSAQVARDCGFDVRVIASADFNHGGTRNAAAMACNAAVVVFLTQDAIVQGGAALSNLVDVFADARVAVAYGRQLPHGDANPVAAHARHFNYRDASYVCGREDIAAMGLKAAFTSNSFAAYRMSVFRELGGFPERTILSEDMYFAARAVLAGHRVAYVASAAVRHSHNYTPMEELRRYFDIGVFQSEESWIGREFGGAGGEGARFLKSELRYLLARAPWWLPRAWLQDAFKIVGYKLGKNCDRLPAAWCRGLSMNRRYWHDAAPPTGS